MCLLEAPLFALRYVMEEVSINEIGCTILTNMDFACFDVGISVSCHYAKILIEKSFWAQDSSLYRVGLMPLRVNINR